MLVLLQKIVGAIMLDKIVKSSAKRCVKSMENPFKWRLELLRLA